MSIEIETLYPSVGRTKREGFDRYFMGMSVSVLWKESLEPNRESELSLGYRLIFMFVFNLCPLIGSTVRFTVIKMVVADICLLFL